MKPTFVPTKVVQEIPNHPLKKIADALSVKPEVLTNSDFDSMYKGDSQTLSDIPVI